MPRFENILSVILEITRKYFIQSFRDIRTYGGKNVQTDGTDEQMDKWMDRQTY